MNHPFLSVVVPRMAGASFVDSVSPTVTLTTAAVSPVIAPFAVTATFSESVTGLTAGEITKVNCTVALAGSGTTYTLTVTPVADGAVSVTIPAGAAQDAAGNGNAASNTVALTADVTAPTCVLTSNAVAPEKDPFTLTITFSEAVTGFAIGDITVTRANLSSFAGSGAVYTCTVTPTSTGTGTIQVAAGVCTDTAGNANTVSNTLSTAYDVTAPTVVLSSAAAATVYAAFAVTATFSEAVTGFVVGDLTVGNGSASNFVDTGDHIVYTFDITPAASGAVTVDIAAGVAIDPAGNPNTAAAQLSRTYAIVYGVSWNKGSSPTLTRTDQSAAFTAQAGVDAGAVTNDFDAAEIYGEITEVTDGAGNVFVRIPKFYIEKTDGVGSKTWRISKVNFSASCYLPKCFWNFATSTELDYVDIGKYPASLDGANLASRADAYPLVNKTIVEMRGYAEANGAGYQQLDIHVVDVLQALFYIEFATLNSQGVMAGYTAGVHSAGHVLTADTNPAGNTLIVANATGALYAIGQAISVGTTFDGNQRFYGRTITNIQADTPGAGSTTITFDGAAVVLATNDILYNTGYKNVDGVAATSGSAVSNSTGKHYCKYREIVSPWGNTWVFVDGLNINDYQAWVAPNADDYASNLFAAPYLQLGYVNHNADGYTTAMGWDANYPYAALPTAVGGGATTYYADYYYRAAGQRIALLGGSWYYGSFAGLTGWRPLSASSLSGVEYGARLVRKGG